MNGAEPRRQRLRAPREDGAALFDPSLAAWTEHFQEDVHSGFDWAQEQSARAELIAAAINHTHQYTDVESATTWMSYRTARVIAAGHQPDLFHPGVWLKNFALSVLGQRNHAIAVNVIADNDTVRSATLKVPTLTDHGPEVRKLEFDAPGDEVPWEERAINDVSLFNSFRERALAEFEPLRRTSHLHSYTPILQALQLHAQPKKSLGLMLAEARHRYERSLGLQTLEVPLSVVCQTRSFRGFAWQLLTDLPRLQSVYNSALAKYRQANRIRSRSHPVPELETRDGWREAPLWIWTTEQPRRQRLWVREVASGYELSNLNGLSELVQFGLTSYRDDALDQLVALEARGIKIRPRALVTTMYCRLFLCDLFIHGIGGAKYDELTDAIIRSYFGCTPPPYLTATATFRLPIERPVVTASDIANIDQQSRELRFHPERFPQFAAAQNSAEFANFAGAKQSLLAERTLRGAQRSEFGQLDQLNRQMHSLLRSRADVLTEQRVQSVLAHAQARLLGSREFSFALFPQETLPQSLLDLCAPGP